MSKRGESIDFKIDRGRVKIANHLGNVVATISDRKKANQSLVNTQLVTHYSPQIQNAQDYFPFGMTMPGRSVQDLNNEYRYGFNGKEQDNEISGEGNSIHYEFREYEPRLGRFKSIDPIGAEYPWQSPFVYHRNNPINSVDYLGLGDPPKQQGTNEGETAQTTYLPKCKECLFVTENWIWHKGGVNGYEAGWMTPSEYEENILKPTTKDFDNWIGSNFETGYTTSLNNYIKNLESSGLSWIGVMEGSSKYHKENPTVDGIEKYIPIWGSAKQAYLDFSVGKSGWGTFNTILAISDVFLLKSVIINGGKFMIGAAGKSTLNSWGAYRKLYGELGMALHGEHMHHVLLRRNGAKTGSGLYWHFMNMPWNLKTMKSSSFLGLKGSQIHTLVHGKTITALGMNWSNSLLGNAMIIHYSTNTFMKTSTNFGIGVMMNSSRPKIGFGF